MLKNYLYPITLLEYLCYNLAIRRMKFYNHPDRIWRIAQVNFVMKKLPVISSQSRTGYSPIRSSSFFGWNS